ncbi:MAG: DUF721 domain-containing protein [Candidatus Malihini olakiniferum]
MRDSRPQSLGFLFDSVSSENIGPLKDIQDRVFALLKLNRAIKCLLPSQLRPWCRIANYRQGHLILETANASCLMRLRYEQPTLLSTLRTQILPSLTSIDIRINPALAANKDERYPEKDNLQVEKRSSSTPLRYLSDQSIETIWRLVSHNREKSKKILKSLGSSAEAGICKTNKKKK